MFKELKDIASEEFGVKIKKVKRETPLTFEELFGVEITNMDKNEQTEGMQKIIEKMYEKTDAITTTDIINRFVEEGYHKTVWHKELPESTGTYLVACRDEYLFEYDVDSYENFWNGKRWVYNEGRVIAWTELPTYEE